MLKRNTSLVQLLNFPFFYMTFQKAKSQEVPVASNTDIAWDIISGLNKVIGVFVMITLAYKWSNYLATLHENHFWFTNIKV